MFNYLGTVRASTAAPRAWSVGLVVACLSGGLGACDSDDDTGSKSSAEAKAGSGGSSAGSKAGASGASGKQADAVKAGAGGKSDAPSDEPEGGAGGTDGTGDEPEAGAGGAGDEPKAGTGGASAEPKAGAGGVGGSGPEAKNGYGLITSVSSADSSMSYFAFLDAVAPQEVKLSDAREFSGLADAWVHDGAVFVTSKEDVTITKYHVKDGELVPETTVSFADYGLDDLGFWTNIFISPTKAFLIHGVTEYVVWNPKEMVILGTVQMPKLTAPKGLKPFASYTDRSVVIRDGLLYHPFYYTDDDYFSYSPTSSIAVYDVKTDKLVRVIEAPCPGLDHATIDEKGDIYFSAWIFAPGGAATLDQPATCVAKIAKSDDKATVAFQVKDITDGREGGVFRYTGNGNAILSVIHPDHATAEELGDPAAVTYGANWRFWSYDFKTGKASVIDSIDWNAGAAYAGAADGKAYALLPDGGYTSTTIWDVTNPADPKSLFKVDGWVLRLFELP